MKTPVIKTENLTKTYGGINRVDGLNLKIPEGKIYGFLGANGAGKTTTMKMLLGLTPPSGGRIEIFGTPFEENRIEILKKTGSIIENPSYYGHLTGKENLKLLEKILDVSEEESEKVLKLVGLYEERDKKVKNYSLGMKQRLAIAMALLRDPKLLILDEPTNGLDPEGIREIRELLKSLARKRNITVMISSHQLSEIEKIADIIGILKDGKLIFEGTLKELERYKKLKTTLETDDGLLGLEVLSDYHPKLLDDKLVFENLKKEEIPPLIKKLVNAGIGIYELSHEQLNLEDLYFEIIGERDEPK